MYHIVGSTESARKEEGTEGRSEEEAEEQGRQSAQEHEEDEPAARWQRPVVQALRHHGEAQGGACCVFTGGILLLPINTIW